MKVVRVMKSLCLVLVFVLGWSVPGCSMFTKSSRQERAYSKYLKKAQRGRQLQRSHTIPQRGEMPSLRTAPPPQRNPEPPESQ